MSIRRVARTVLVSIAAVSAAGAFSILTLSAPAGAAAPAQGSIVPNSAVPNGTVTGGTPFSSGQQINVVVPANSVFTGAAATANVEILECAAPNGVPPLSAAGCDANTLNVDTFAPNSDGSINYHAENGDYYPVYALPDSVTFSESPSGVQCGSTSATECILYIGDNYNSFSAPMVWSQPFFVKANGDDLGENPGDGTPEVPYAILLPLAAMGLIGATVLVRRRRSASHRSTSVNV